MLSSGSRVKSLRLDVGILVCFCMILGVEGVRLGYGIRVLLRWGVLGGLMSGGLLWGVIIRYSPYLALS